MAGKCLVGVDFFQATDHTFAHGVKFRTVSVAQGGTVGIAIRSAGFDGNVHPAGLLRIERIAKNQTISSIQCLFARAGIARFIAPYMQ
ncbi:hypothetical protein CJO86_15620 [Ralstonia solanacearum]|nr:hypothetical protein CJO86_15620 [Ralstonia solanacearum]